MSEPKKWDLVEIVGPRADVIQIVDNGSNGLSLLTDEDGSYFEREQIEKLITHLLTWLKTGSLKPRPEC